MDEEYRRSLANRVGDYLLAESGFIRKAPVLFGTSVLLSDPLPKLAAISATTELFSLYIGQPHGRYRINLHAKTKSEVGLKSKFD